MIRKSILIPFGIIQAILTFVMFYYLKGDSFVSALVMTILFSAIFLVIEFRGRKKQQRKEDEEYAKKWGMDVGDL